MKKYILLFITVSLLISCDDNLDLNPSSSVATDNAFKNENDFENAVRGMYFSQLTGGAYYGGQLQGYDVMTDNLLISQVGRFSQQFRHDWDYNPNSGFSGFLGNTYAVIYNANEILNRIETLEDSDTKNNIMGEALGIRALAHFDLARYFAKIPTQEPDAGSSLAMPYVTIADINSLPERITVDNYYELVIEDLVQAESLINTDNGKYQLGKDGINAILARVYLHTGEWQKAIDAANQVTTNIAPRSSFVGVWNDSNDDGVIFKLQNDNQAAINLGAVFNQTTDIGIKDEYVPDFAFYQQYTDTDIRKIAYFETSPYGTIDYNHIIKWYSSTSTTSLGVVDPKILRAAEVILTKAEALAKLDRDDEALVTLDQLRSQRYIGFVSGGEEGQTLEEAIATERRLELAFEGMRFSDIKRNGDAINRSNFGDFANGTGIPAAVNSLPKGDFRFQTPIPLNEININENMKQNPGYGN